jgi:Protein of unknown function (DUF2855)
MDLEVARDDLRRARIVPGRPLSDELAADRVLCRIESFALTANNVTYAVTGDELGYWDCFPASEEGWGRVPAWGYGEVVTSAHPGVGPGERFFGFWPMSSHLLLEPVDVGPRGFVDGAEHRAGLSVTYNRYQRAASPGDPDAEGRSSLLRPLFVTSFLLDDWLGEHDSFGAKVIVVSSASSKTALALGHLLREHRRGDVVGLTSRTHVDFVAGAGAFDRVVAYDDVTAGLDGESLVYVDIAGDADVLVRIQENAADRLRRIVRVGFTHHDSLPAHFAEAMFFAPDHMQRRAAEWGGAGFIERLESAQRGFERGPGSAIALVRRRGASDVAAAWVEAVDGRADPATGMICSW